MTRSFYSLNEGVYFFLITFQVHLSLGLTEDDFKFSTSVLRDRVKSLPFPELHDESFSDLFFLKSCFRLMRICGLPDDFGWKDLHCPTSKRFRKQLSAAINFVKFREDRLQMYSELHDQRDELLSGLVEVNEEQSSLNSQLDFSIRDAKKRWDEVNMIEKKCSLLEAEIASQNKLQASIRQESTELKKRANELKDKIATSVLTINEMEAEKKALMTKVVEDPGKVIKKLNELKNSIRIEREAYEIVQNDMCASKLKLMNVMKAEKDLINVMSLMNDLKSAMIKFDGIKAEVQTMNVRILKKDKEIQRIQQNCDMLKHEIYIIEENFENSQKQTKAKIKSAQDSLDRAKDELILVEKDRDQNIERVEANEVETRSIVVEIEREKKKTQFEIADIIEVFKKMEQQVIESDKKIFSLIAIK